MVSMTVTGGEDLARTLRALPETVRPVVMLRALTQAAEPMKASMEAKAPRGPDSPHLAENIAISQVQSVEGVRLDTLEVAVAVGPTKDFFYGFFWEYGWSKHPMAQPFVRPAYDENVERSLELISSAMWQAIAAEAEA